MFSGWALDSDVGTRPISVRLDVYRYDQRVSGWAVWFDRAYTVVADRLRTDVSSSHGAGQNHGFRIEIPTITGNPITTLLAKVCVTAINQGPGADALLNPTVRTWQTSGNCWHNVWFE